MIENQFSGVSAASNQAVLWERLVIGQTVNHYRIVRKLGEGGMGEVFLAEDTRLDRQVALKFLPPGVADDPDALERFQREAKAAAALDHPNIITVHEIGEHEGRAYIVMSYVGGGLLSESIGADMSVERALDVATQIAEGLSRAHQAGIVHRDIKPDNVALDAEGNARILDFGLAKLRGSARLTQEQSTVGTLHYMSPEQVRGDDVDARSDLFSLGALLYEMISGRTPFEGEHAAAVQYAIANEDPQPLSRFNNQVTPELERIVAKLLRKDVAARYQTAADVLADIRALRSGPVEVAGARPSRRTLPWVVTAAVIVGAALLAIFNPFGKGRQSADDARPMLAVLPFENLGQPDDEFFADGITEEITSRLATIAGLGVISRTSAMRYKGSSLSLADIARELGVGYVIEGTVRWDKSQQPERVRITPQLIRVSDDTHLWADNYERALDRIFEVQADIATHIASAMEVTLLDKERRVIELVPTTNTEAYTLYLQAVDRVTQSSGLSTGRLEEPIAILERVVELDPEFAVAWAKLGTLHASYYHNGIDRTPARLATAEKAVRRGLELDPDHPDTRIAMAYYYYWGLKDYQTAIEWVERAGELRPGDGEILRTYAWIQRRLGNYPEAIDYLKRSLVLSPGSIDGFTGVGECYMLLHDYTQALQYFRRAQALNPDNLVPYFYLWWVAQCQGDFGQARRELAAYARPDTVLFPFLWYEQNFTERRFARAIEVLEPVSRRAFSGEDAVRPVKMLTGFARHAMGDTSGARQDFTAARTFVENQIEERPDDHRLYSALGLILAMLGERDAAVANGIKATELYPVSKDRYMGTWPLTQLCRIYALANYPDESLSLMDELLGMNTFFSPGLLDTSPLFDNVRDDPRFHEILAKHRGGA